MHQRKSSAAKVLGYANTSLKTAWLSGSKVLGEDGQTPLEHEDVGATVTLHVLQTTGKHIRVLVQGRELYLQVNYM